MIDERVGSGAEARPGNQVTVHYTDWLYDETAKDQRSEKFDASADHGQPFSFPLDGGQVIRGWDEGVAGMRVGGKRKLMLPAE